MSEAEFDRCVRVNSRDVFIVKGNERVHVKSYDDLRETWGDPPVEDVPESEIAGIKLVKRFSKPRKAEEEAAEEPDVRAPEEV